MYTKLRRYKDKEFCKDVKCPQLHQNTINPEHFYCKRREEGCTKTAKEFHHWLNEKGFHLLAPVDVKPRVKACKHDTFKCGQCATCIEEEK